VKIAPEAAAATTAAEIAAAVAARAGRFFNICDVYNESLGQMLEAFVFENVLIQALAFNIYKPAFIFAI
jgi:hypothetical protein